jgi:hypothetical protein
MLSKISLELAVVLFETSTQLFAHPEYSFLAELHKAIQ